MKKQLTFCFFLAGWLVFLLATASARQHAVVFQSDFGVKDGAVASMKGVAFAVDSSLHIFDLTHEIPPFNIWEAAYRLYQTLPYWPPGTVFVSVVDPGVGTQRKSVVLKTKSGHFIVSPDNGTLTLVAEHFLIEEVRKIDESFNRRQGSELSHTFHGRDVYAFTGARLASGVINFQGVGPLRPPRVVSIPYQKAGFTSGILYGSIPVLDVRYGNVWSNIGSGLLDKMKIKVGDVLCVDIHHGNQKMYSGKAPYVKSFGYVPKGQPLIYLNELLNVSVALNQGNFAQKHRIQAGAQLKIMFKKCDR